MSDANQFSIGGSWVDEFECGTVQCFGIVQGKQVFASAFDEDFYVAQEKASMIVNSLNERDAYRDMCVELLNAGKNYLPHMPISTAKEGGANRHSEMLKKSDNLKDAIIKAEKLLGENK